MKYQGMFLFSIIVSGTLYTMEQSPDIQKAKKIFELIEQKEWLSVKKILNKNKHIMTAEKDGNTILCAILNEIPYVAPQQELIEFVLSLKKSSRLINKPGYSKDKKSMTALQFVIRAIDPEVLKVVDPDQTLTDYRITPAIMDLLLDHGENPRLKNNDNQSALEMAEALKQKELADYLNLPQEQRRPTITKPTPKKKHCIIV